ncbi:MAG TPA: ABC transporter ATP-binding protein, partial [Planctomycetaceae bacterium]|nr:ABC transporter ATP-binding protein [Planctomycetaceae bacterium]
GSGKSTTIKLILGLLFPTSGRVLVFGKDATDARKNERIGYLPEESYLYKFLNAEETLDFYGRLFNMSAAQRRERIDELIDMVKLNWARRRPLKEYSKGMTRRIGLAQALINDPDLVLLDEPTTGLDPLGTDDMKEMILELKARGKTVVMCSHLLPDIQDVCDRVAILYNGELKEQGRLSDLLTIRDEVDLRIKELPEEGRRELEALVAKYGSEIVHESRATSTLKDLFMKIVRESEERPGKRAPGAVHQSSEPR